jgi:hypothetical protein
MKTRDLKISMNKKSTYLILVIFINTALAMLVFGAGTKGKTSPSTRLSPVGSLRRTGYAQRTFILPDGFMLMGVDGKLTQSFDAAQDGKDSNDCWFFEFDSVVIDSIKTAGVMKLELLPSSALEKMIADANDSSAADYRLAARITKYKDRNFIFPLNFLPLSVIKDIPSESLQQAQPEAQPIQQEIEEPNNWLGIPKEILEKIKIGSASPSTDSGQSGRTVRVIAGRQTQIKQNYVLVNRTGFLVKKSDGNMVFSLDALGRSAGSAGDIFQLLPCQALELAEQLQSAVPDQVRFKIAGLVTEYRGEKFLLLHRAIRVYSHGNFGR